MKNLNSLSLAAAKKLFLKAREQYYNSGNSELTDQEFDALEDRIRAEEPKWEPLHSTGISVPKKFEVRLNSYMPSLDKIKSDVPEGVERWLAKVGKIHPHLHISEKIDGSSIQGVWKKGVLTKLATRGDGINGKDISGFIPYVNIPREVELFAEYPTVVVRFEATIPLSVYNKRYQGAYDSDRAMASAILNRQDVSPALRHIEFVALRVLDPVLDIRTSQEMLKDSGFLTPRSKVIAVDSLSTEALATLAANVKAKSEYSTDGLVLFTCSENTKYLNTVDRPEYAHAFKLNDLENAVETEIIDIQWNPSSFGVVVPKAIVKPVKFGNVTVKQAALHNAAWAKERGAGIGAKVKLIRSGEIIPKIVEVIQPAKLMIPLEKGTWYWDETKTNVVLKNPEDNPEVLAKKFTRFFGKLELEDVAGGLAAKLVTAGYTNTAELCHLKKTDFAALPGIKSSAGKIAEQVGRVQAGEFDLITLMVASGLR
jgi:NAD-dependent DNA ligase